ncbi:MULTISPECIES: hypothetical protein [unclassified Haladaptatus]|uniref:hypothetical protein n=1 Tax=unclassified Haladaptatus TaxID=2622732 RepID=UPI0023E8CE3B|nr:MULTISPECIES: hypothetical protein [unclassified Haladaptatus]
MALIDSVILFVVSLLVGGFGIYVGARVITDVDDYGQAVITALIGAVVWAVLSFLPLIGTLLALIAYIAVVNWRYPGGWVNAIAIALVAWVTATVVLFILGTLNIISLSAIGIPGV